MRKPNLRAFFAALLILLASGCPESDTPEPEGDAGVSKSDSDVPKDTQDIPEDTGKTGNKNIVCGGLPDSNAVFPSNDVSVRIVSPAGTWGATVTGGQVQLAGNAFGDISSMTWKRTAASGATAEGTITPAFFWATAPPVPLEPGDNLIEVTATGTDGKQKGKDFIRVTTCPAPLGPAQLVVSPDHVFVGEARVVRAALRLDSTQIKNETITLMVVNEQGESVGDNNPVMLDDGKGCDQWPGDRVYSACITLQQSTSEPVWLRTNVAMGQMKCATPIQQVASIDRITPNQCSDMLATIENAAKKAKGSEVVAVGTEAAQNDLKSAPNVLMSGLASDGQGAYVQFNNGALGAVPVGAAGYRAAPGTKRAALAVPNTISSRQVAVLRGSASATELDTLTATVSQGCPPYNVVSSKKNADTQLDMLRYGHDFGVVALAGHGGVYFGTDDGQPPKTRGQRWRHSGPQVVYWTGDPVNCSEFLGHSVKCDATSKCSPGSICITADSSAGQGECVNATQVDLARGELIMGPGTWGVSPTFVDRYLAGKLQSALAYAGACSSLWNGSMALAFLASGAVAYAGHTGPVSNDFAVQIAEKLFKGFFEEGKSANDAMCYAADPSNTDSLFLLAGNKALKTATEGLLNTGFQASGLLGWKSKGDARRVTSFCGTTANKGMALLSSGLGKTDILGELSQRICIPEGTQTMRFRYRYYSAELEQSCNGQTGQDMWTISLKKDKAPALDLKKCTVTDMCKPSLPQCGITPNQPCDPKTSTCPCGKCFDPAAPYAPTDACTFDGAPVHATVSNWAEMELPVGNFAGQGPVTLTFQVYDQGSAGFDTAILLDDVEFK